MIKNVLIGLLSVLLVGAGISIALDRRSEVGTEGRSVETEGVGDGLEDERESKHTTDASESDEVREVSIVGAWQSTDDPQSEITFTRDGEVVDVYGGGVIHEAGSYQIFESPTDLPQTVTSASDGPFLRETFGEEEYYYEIEELTDSSLTLIFISGQGAVLRYERIGS